MNSIRVRSDLTPLSAPSGPLTAWKFVLIPGVRNPIWVRTHFMLKCQTYDDVSCAEYQDNRVEFTIALFCCLAHLSPDSDQSSRVTRYGLWCECKVSLARSLVTSRQKPVGGGLWWWVSTEWYIQFTLISFVVFSFVLAIRIIPS